MALSCTDVLELERNREQKSLLSNVIPCAAYSYRAPLPPAIDIRVPRRTSLGIAMELNPSYQGVDPSQLTSEDLQIITQNSKQLAFDGPSAWAYDDRYAAQAVLDYLYLGPTSTIRNHEFLSSQGITMMVVVRDLRTAGTLRSVDQASRELGIRVEYVRVGDFSHLIQALPDMIGLINHHLLSVYHDAQSAMGRTAQQGPGPTMETEPRPRRGKVLITCDSGNHSSATIVAAYLMSVFGQDMVSAVQFVLLQRFSCVFDEDTKLMLRSWEEIVRARSMTAHHHLQSAEQGQTLLQVSDTNEEASRAANDQPQTLVATSTRKRGFDDMVSGFGGSVGGEALETDEARFMDRDRFVPFADLSEVGGSGELVS
ncbi:hypothetical protein E4U55_004683 [Claviceps digitariae]|nr:hypothetical protein E4U55_004683 [Claviceps digitariae]